MQPARPFQCLPCPFICQAAAMYVVLLGFHEAHYITLQLLECTACSRDSILLAIASYSCTSPLTLPGTLC